MAEEQRIFYEWPGDMRSIAGGTRTTIKLSRPWQEEIKPHKGNCPFCDPNDPARIQYFEEADGWWLRQNIFTPYPFHQMVVPAKCWEPNELRTLGGEKIATALGIALDTVQKCKAPSVFITVHIGSLAGQNLPHLHWHIVQYNMFDSRTSVGEDMLGRYFHLDVPEGISWKLRRPDLVLFQNLVFTAVVGGVRAGQCFILQSTRPEIRGNKDLYCSASLHCLAESIYKIVSLYNKKFLSTEVLPPDFNIAISCYDGSIQYALYTPILNHWGSAEQAALYEKCHITLPWPHETTALYLKSD